MTQNSPVIIDNETGNILNDEELANQAASDVFETEENSQKTGNLISTFVDSYTRHKNTLPLDIWLEQEFSNYDVWGK